MNTLAHPLVEKACRLAEHAHAGQTRRGGRPYIEHCYAVAARLTDPVDQAVAMLHDTVEDARLRFSDLDTEGLPPEVIDGVNTLTRGRSIATGEWSETYEAFIARIKAHRQGRWVRVKVADILSNLADSPTDQQCVKYGRALVALLS